ncbi:protein suppressor of sable-like [Toxorhynchites rutilus septentrionalis]|uniref:protein suppressor of sable-like n=1 Tax=Toxorhynchites rutilus septentrionalis TaxID=329112 RepID=UPI002478CFAF|nr:protein suppressor of sable-like [Toxorhynchites rutilus septentrionalis]XP_055626812.1 protein suppressor of sable-like [Toxorhynchites rutilus septentrionalis]
MSEHEDLEDGEIEDGEIEDDEDDFPVVATCEPVTQNAHPIQIVEDEWDDDTNTLETREKTQNVKNINDSKPRLIDEPASVTKSSKRSKPSPVVDDWATSVENAIANALKKDGVQPPMPTISNHNDENESSEVPTKRKKREKHKKKLSPNKLDEMDEMDLEYEMLHVRGGSPRPTLNVGAKNTDRSDSEDSYSSDESRDHERDRDRDRDRERRDRDRERDREYNRRKRKNRQRNRANRDGRKRKRDDSDDDKHHSRSNGPRKMELCKFYLMDCCAKREKCLYMHSDFPCKYYYLGLKCKEKEKCLFSHGEPLTDELRAILMKHLETAPQEILGDFPRISRESAATMVNATHRKLMEKFGMTDKTVTDNPAASGKIPSLLELMEAGDRGNKNRRSRWCEKSGGTSHGRSKANDGSGDDFLSLKYLTGVISQDQIVKLEEMGIHNLDQISQLTVAQLNELGLSIGQINELQLNTLNMKTLRDNISKQDPKSDDPDFVETAPHKDLDMRITPTHRTLQKDEEIPSLGGKDVDMRFLPLVNNVQETPGGENSNSQEGQLELVSTSLNSLIKTPTVDYSQYLKDSNLNDDEEIYNTENADKLLIAHDDEDDDDDENNLKISIDDEEQDESGKDSSSKPENEERKAENKLFNLQPAVFDTKLVSHSLATHKIDYSKPFGMYRSAEEEYGKPEESCILDRYENDSDSAKGRTDIYSRKSMYSNSTVSEIPSTYKGNNSPNSLTVGWTPTSGSVTSSNPTTKVNLQAPKPSRASIYDDPYASDNSDDSDSKSKTLMYGEKDKDMRLNFLQMDGKLGDDSNAPNDIDLRLPFKPIMTNYIPATEIDGSISSNPSIEYKVYEIDIPKPNYKDIRRNTPRPERTKDPRLKRIFGMYNDDDNVKQDSLIQSIRSPTHPSSNNVTAGPIAPRIDPRTKRNLESKPQTQGTAVDNSIIAGTSGNKANSSQFDVQSILQRSNWYTDLSSKHKIMVNQQLAILSTEMKKYHNSDKSTEKLADFMQLLANNQMLQFILTNLNVYVDDSVSFCEVPLVPSQPPPLLSVPPPNINLHSMSFLPPVNIPPPVSKPPSLFDLPRFNCPPEVRPGLLGVAPNMPFEQFLAMGQINKSNPPPLLDEWDDNIEDGLGGGGGPPGNGGFQPNFERNFSNVRNNVMRGNNRMGNNFRNNDRWNNSRGGGGGGNPNRRNNNPRRMDKKK